MRIVTQELLDDADFDRLFTPERLAHIDEAAAQIDTGDFFTAKQAEAQLAKRRSEWLQNNALTVIRSRTAIEDLDGKPRSV